MAKVKTSKKENNLPKKNLKVKEVEVDEEDLEDLNILPMQSDEFLCGRCFLVKHQLQFAKKKANQKICIECI